MTSKQYVLYALGGRQVSSYRFGKLVERRYIDLVPTDTASADLDIFLAMLGDRQQATDAADFGHCRVGYVDENGVGRYYDASEFLANHGIVDRYIEPNSLLAVAR